MFSVVSVFHSVRKGTHVTIIRNALDVTEEGSLQQVASSRPPVMAPYCKETTPATVVYLLLHSAMHILNNRVFSRLCSVYLAKCW